MFKNYLKIALRNFRKYKIYSFINIFGLSIGIACCLLILLFVKNEMTYDRFHEKTNRIYRLFKLEKRPAGVRQNAALPPTLAKIVAEELPEIERVVRLFVPFNEGTKLIQYEGKWLEEKVHFADPDFFNVFTFPLLKGASETALQDPNSVVLSERIAGKLFGKDEPLGKSISIGIGGKDHRFVVSGVTERIPGNSSLRFSVLLNYQRVEDELQGFFGKDILNSWNNFTELYLEVGPKTKADDLEKKLAAIVEKYSGTLVQSWRLVADENAYQLRLQALTDVHLDPDVRSSITPARNQIYSYILSGIALLLLFLACINFMTFSVGRSLSRACEVGIRKILGAGRSQLMKQFWGEAFVMTFIAFVVALTIAEFLLPTFNALAGESLSMAYFSNWRTLILLVGLLLLTGFVAGSFPAVVLSRFQAVEALKTKLKVGGNNLFSRGLVVFQFSLSILLLMSTITMFRQLNYLQTKDLGFNEEQIIVIPTRTDGDARLLELYKTALLPHQGIISITGSDGSFAQTSLSIAVHTNDQELSVATYRVDFDYLKTLGISLLEGRNFVQGMQTDLSDAVIINESLVNALEWKSAVGKEVPIGFPNKTVIGVVKDYHFEPLHQKIGPLLLHMNPGRPIKNIFVRISPENISATLSLLEEQWQAISANMPLTYSFLDETVNLHYEAEKRWGKIVSYAAILAVVISCLGLFGLSTLAVAQRTKEIGIRKVLGATVANVTALLSKDFVWLVLLANIIAWPIAYFAMNRWLENYAYRIEMGLWLFALAGGLAFFFALLSVTTQAIRAALANPVNIIRYE